MEEKTYALPAGFVDLLLDAVCLVDATGRFVFASAACERIFGYTPQELIGRPLIELVVPEDRERTRRAASEVMSGQAKLNFENRYVHKDGRIVHILWSARWSEAEQLRIAVARDITERKQAELMQAAFYAISEAAHAAEDLHALFQRIHQIIGRLLPAPNFSVAMRDEKAGGLSFTYHADEDGEAAEPREPVAATLCTEVIRTGQPLLMTLGSSIVLGEQLPTPDDDSGRSWLGVPLNSQKGIIGALILRSGPDRAQYTEGEKDLLQFVSTQIATAVERKRLDAQLQYMAQYDALTDLPNRVLLLDRLETSLARRRRDKGRMALLYIDLDHFKQVNDSFGHEAGDRLLQEVAQRMKQCVRKQDTVARMGGDEFVVLLDEIQQAEHAVIVADKLRSAISEAVHIGDSLLSVMPSIGIALYPEQGQSVRQLLDSADAAMFGEKKSK